MIIASTVLGRLDVLWLKRPADRVKTRFVEVRCWGRGTEIVIGGTERIISWLPRRSEREQQGASRAERGASSRTMAQRRASEAILGGPSHA
jgi:hypothetical protein